MRIGTLPLEARAMRLSRVRFTVRWIMVAVAVVALVMAPYRRWAYCRIQAGRHEQRWQSLHGWVLKCGGCLCWFADGKSGSDWLREGIRHHKMAEAYEDAACRPWLPLPAELAEPK